MLKAEGSLHASEEITLATAQGPRAIAVGETLVFRRDGTLGGGKDGPMDVVTGDRARVTELDSRRQTLTLRMGEQEWQVPAHALTHADYGYAQPLRDAQGATVDRAFLLDHPSIHGAYAVVAVSRHREALTIHADASRTPDIASLAAHWSRPLGTTKLAELSNPRPTPFLLARQQRMQR